ncbi:MAG: YcgN family cysteine cluster protein [Paracoccaceae bacterium]|nr:YcgN family cysteine cluster protein [Paracoccaceae bacterium]MDO7634155.1 YcgN family cysteine cluster protein [Paracoccaceae bacterium]
MTENMRPKFWETLPLEALTHNEWEALCDGCGKCCLNKLEFEDTGEVAFTRLACQLLDGETCRCKNYENRRDFVPDCVQVTPERLPNIVYWLPRTCAYRRLHEGKPLLDWHPLISGTTQSVHDARISVQGWTLPETSVPTEDWEDYLIEETP